VVVDAGVNKKQRGRPLLEVDGEVCSKNYLTGPTLLEMSGKRTNQELGVESVMLNSAVFTLAQQTVLDFLSRPYAISIRRRDLV
jgi:hypothetical protein